MCVCETPAPEYHTFTSSLCSARHCLLCVPPAESLAKDPSITHGAAFAHASKEDELDTVMSLMDWFVAALIVVWLLVCMLLFWAYGPNRHEVFMRCARHCQWLRPSHA